MKLPSLKSLTDPSTIIPVGVGAAALGFAGYKIAKSPKVKVLSGNKYKTPIFVVAGLVVGAIIGKIVADTMLTKPAITSTPDVQPKTTMPSEAELVIQ